MHANKEQFAACSRSSFEYYSLTVRQIVTEMYVSRVGLHQYVSRVGLHHRAWALSIDKFLGGWGESRQKATVISLCRGESPAGIQLTPHPIHASAHDLSQWISEVDICIATAVKGMMRTEVNNLVDAKVNTLVTCV